MSEFIGKTIEKMTERKVISRITDNSIAFSVDKSKVLKN